MILWYNILCIKNYSEVFTVCKKITVSVLALLLICGCLFAGCSKKGEYVNPATGEKYDMVTDAEGNKVLSDDGELLVYAKDENGEYVTDESGEKVTQVQGFVGQIEEKGVVEDYAYKISTPDGWKYIGNGTFENKSGNIKVDISILKKTMANYVENNKRVAEEVKKNGYECTFEDVRFDAVGVDGKSFKIKSDEVDFSVAAFIMEGNLFQIRAVAENNGDTDSALDTFLSAITFKPYKYYEDSELEDITVPVTKETQASELTEGAAEVADAQ